MPMAKSHSLRSLNMATNIRPLRKQQMDHQEAISAAQDADKEPPAQASPLISKADAKELLEEIEVEIKEIKWWRESDKDA